MTDKEVIIVDGVNVLECDEYYIEQVTDQVKCSLSGRYCEENKNCLFKQLARKTQECEDLKLRLRQGKDNNKSTLKLLANKHKDLSRELCEICGIEGEWVEYTTETTDGCVNLGKKQVFPDFTEPENFVKLFNLKINNNLFGNTLAYFITSDSKIVDIKDFLIVLLNILKSVEECKVNKIKQAIKLEVWKYD